MNNCWNSLNINLSFRVHVTFIKANGEKIETKGKIGDSLLDVVVNNNIDLDGFGACEGKTMRYYMTFDIWKGSTIKAHLQQTLSKT